MNNKKKQPEKNQTQNFPPALYASVFRSTVTDRDLFLECFQPAGDNTFSLIARLVMPLASAQELNDLMKQQLEKNKKSNT